MWRGLPTTPLFRPQVSYDAASLRQSLDAFRRYTGRILADDAIRNQPSVFSEVLRQTVGPDRHRRFWQSTRHPIAVRTQRFWKQKLDYIHANPVRKGLVQYPEDGRFSSARHYATGNPAGNDVNITQITW